MTKDLPSPEFLRKLLRYEPETGKLFWRERTPDMFKTTKARSAEHACALWNACWSGKEAFCNSDKDGYKKGVLLYKTYGAHRVIWAVHFGFWPKNMIDHIDRNPENNRIENLREAAASQNACNRGLRVDNTSGYKGVFWNNLNKNWRAKIKKKGKSYYLGSFPTAEEAYAAYCQAAEKLHGEYARVE